MATMTASQMDAGGRPADLLERIRVEYAEMPGLTLTVRQAARLWAIDLAESVQLFEELAGEGFLVCDKETGVFKRPGCPECVH